MRDVYVAAAAVVRYSLAGYIQSVVHCSLAARRKELKESNSLKPRPFDSFV